MFCTLIFGALVFGALLSGACMFDACIFEVCARTRKPQDHRVIDFMFHCYCLDFDSLYLDGLNGLDERMNE